MQLTIRLLKFLVTLSAFVVGPAMSEVLKPIADQQSSFQRQRKTTRGQDSRQTPQSKNTYHSPVFSPDGRKLAFIQQESNSKKSQGNQRLCWADLDARTLFCFPESFTEPSSGLVFSVAMQRPSFSPDGQTILFAANTQDYACGAVFVANLDATHMRRLSVCQSHPTDSTFSPDGKYIAFIGSDKINVIDLEGRIVSKFPADIQESVQSRFTFSADGKQILYVSMHGTTEKYNVYLENLQERTRTRVAELQRERYADTIPNASISPDGKAVVFTMPIGPRNPLRQEYDLSQYELLTTRVGVYTRARLTNDNNFDQQPIFIGNGTGILFISTQFTSSTKPEEIESRIRAMGVDGNSLKTIARAKRIRTFSVSPNAKRIAFEGSLSQGDADVYIVNLDGTGQSRLRDLLSVQSVPSITDALSNEQGRPAPTTEPRLAPASTLLQTLRTEESIDRVAFSSDGLTLATVGIAVKPQKMASGQPVDYPTGTGSIKIWRVKDGTLLRDLRLEIQNGQHIGLSQDLKTIAVIVKGGMIEIRKADDNSLIRTLDGYWNWGIVFSPNGRFLAAGSSLSTRSGAISIVEVSNGKEVRRLSLDHGLTIFTFTPDGRLLAEVGCPASLWDISSGRELKSLSRQFCQAKGIAFSPDGTMVGSFAVDNTAQFWRVSDGRLLRRIQIHSAMRFANRPYGLVNGIAFSPDGKTLASASDGFDTASGTPNFSRALQTWQVSDGRLLQTLPGNTKAVNCVAFSPDGQVLASGGADGTIRLWRVK